MDESRSENPGGVSEEVAALVARGRKIDAIKRHREETGCGLLAAKEAIDALAHRSPTAIAGAAPLAPHPLPAPHAASGRSNGAAVLAATVLCGFSFSLLSTGLIRSVRASSWPEAPAEILDSSIRPGTASSSQQAEVVYRYAVDGVEHSGSRVAYARIEGPWFTEETHRRYPVGARVSAHYDPEDPSRAVLDPSVPRAYEAFWVVSLVGLAWGLRGWWRNIRREREDRIPGASS